MEQAAIIFFRSGALSLDKLGEFLASLGCTVEKTQWSLGKALGKSDSEIDADKARDVLKRIIPQLRLHSPVQCLMQIETNSYVLQEAAEFARNYGSGLSEENVKLWAICDERIMIGGDDSPVVEDANGVTAVAGFAFSSFDPGSEQAMHLLRAVTRFANGILWDNLNGIAWAADRS